MANRVVVSTNHCRNYAWYTPLTCMAWKKVTGFIPTVICVGDGIDPEILKRAEEAGGDLIHIPDILGYNAAGIAQMCRLYAYGEPRCAGDYLMTTDVDAWPLTTAPFLPSGRSLDAYMSCWPILPIGYIGARAETWRAFMGAAGNSVEECLRAGLREPDAGDAFNTDEGLVTRKVGEWFYPGEKIDLFGVVGRLLNDHRARVVIRPGNEYADNRVWFGRWPEPMPAGMVDAHLCSRNSHPTWAQLVGLLRYANVDGASIEWAEKYHREVPSW
jgi:hypothetical protein